MLGEEVLAMVVMTTTQSWNMTSVQGNGPSCHDRARYRTCYFAMTVMNNQLVLVGGGEHGDHMQQGVGFVEG